MRHPHRGSSRAHRAVARPLARCDVAGKAERGGGSRRVDKGQFALASSNQESKVDALCHKRQINAKSSWIADVIGDIVRRSKRDKL